LYSKSHVQANPQTGKHVVRISTPLCWPMCLCSDLLPTLQHLAKMKLHDEHMFRQLVKTRLSCSS